ncbi:MAG: hypothetical protein ACR2PA_22090 [Hyphomicrobiaceae bacterium]
MMKKLGHVAAALALLWLSAATAFAKNGYICDFQSGMVNTFENDVFQIKRAKALSFEIGDIDLAKQAASLVTPNGKGGLKIVRAIGANHFLEVITEGFLNITTIYGEPAGDGTFPAVHSRHIGLLGMPVVSQYLGTCKAK